MIDKVSRVLCSEVGEGVDCSAPNPMHPGIVTEQDNRDILDIAETYLEYLPRTTNGTLLVSARSVGEKIRWLLLAAEQKDSPGSGYSTWPTNQRCRYDIAVNRHRDFCVGLKALLLFTPQQLADKIWEPVRTEYTQTRKGLKRLVETYGLVDVFGNLTSELQRIEEVCAGHPAMPGDNLSYEMEEAWKAHRFLVCRSYDAQQESAQALKTSTKLKRLVAYLPDLLQTVKKGNDGWRAVGVL